MPLDANNNWTSGLVHPDVDPYTSSSGGGGAQMQGDGDPTETPDIETDETILYWDRTGKKLWTWDSDEAGWYPVAG